MKLIRALMLATATLSLVVSPMLVSDVQAQRRGGRRAAAPRAGGVVVAAYYRPAFISPFYYDPFYDPWWYPYPYGWGRPYGYGYGRYYDEDTASLRLQVTPRETQVYVDGYYAGEVDQFDGVFQRLRLESGSHEVALYLPGHRTATQSVFLQDQGTFRIRHTMEQLAAGETGDTRPTPVPGAPSANSRARDRGPVRRVEPRNEPRQDPRSDPRQENVVRGDSNFGAIALRVQPADAELLIDGERWDGPRDDEALVVQIAPGSHRVEARKDGYRPYSGEIVVTVSETTPLNISLPRQ
ncbi:MAG: PEGA domain-containing protein [Acidobacteria bacterium]|nr:PEGA domain-containing protein [Acidobacteriota bacterium]